ncbi:hypothetical protein OBB02_01450 [Candidatus Puniceispirillum sp.]|nr:hypothetical protein [Candidatus Puniceispirillum sp.]
MRIVANSVILLLMIWALSVSALAFLDITIHFPWVITDADAEAIPYHRLQTIRVGLLITFSYYGLLHLLGKSQQFYPLHFLTTYLFYMLLSGLIIFYRRGVLEHEWGVLLFFGVCLIFCYLAARPEASKYLKYKPSK